MLVSSLAQGPSTLGHSAPPGTLRGPWPRHEREDQTQRRAQASGISIRHEHQALGHAAAEHQARALGTGASCGWSVDPPVWGLHAAQPRCLMTAGEQEYSDEYSLHGLTGWQRHVTGTQPDERFCGGSECRSKAPAGRLSHSRSALGNLSAPGSLIPSAALSASTGTLHPATFRLVCCCTLFVQLPVPDKPVPLPACCCTQSACGAQEAVTTGGHTA